MGSGMEDQHQGYARSSSLNHEASSPAVVASTQAATCQDARQEGEDGSASWAAVRLLGLNLEFLARVSVRQRDVRWWWPTEAIPPVSRSYSPLCAGLLSPLVPSWTNEMLVDLYQRRARPHRGLAQRS